MLHTFEQVRERTRALVAEHPDYVYDEGMVFGATGDADDAGAHNTAECRYYDPIPYLDGKPVDADDEAELAMLADIIENDAAHVDYRRGQCSCLIGQVLDPWLDEEQRNYVFDHYNTETITNGLFDYLVDVSVLEQDMRSAVFLRIAQEVQDRKETWGQALVEAEDAVNTAVAKVMGDMYTEVGEILGDRA